MTSQTQYDLFHKAANGLKKYGVEAKVHWNLQPKVKNVACWGWRKGEVLRAHGYNVLVFERAYLGDRFYWTSIGWNGLNGRADFCLPDKVSADRFRDNFELKPWKKNGEKIIVMGQLRGDMSLQGLDLTEFYERWARELELRYNKPVFFKEHPTKPHMNFNPRIPRYKGNLEEALSEAFLVVTYNSNSGVDAVVNGIPALSFDKGSMAYSVTGHTINDRITPVREEWAYKLAHCQWTPKEIENGDYWERMKCLAVS